MCEVVTQPSLWCELQFYLEGENYVKSLELIEGILKQDNLIKNEKEDLYRLKLFLLIQDDQLLKAREFGFFLKETCPKLYDKAIYEVAYTCYKMNRIFDGLKLIQNHESANKDELTTSKIRFDIDNKFQILRAQLLYRNGSYEESAKIYETLLNSCSIEKRPLLETNLLACKIGIGNINLDFLENIWNKSTEFESSAYSFNCACLAMYLLNFQKALRFNQQVADYRAGSGSIVSKTEIELQEATIKHSNLVDLESVMDTYRRLQSDEKCVDPTIQLIAQNNLKLLSSDKQETESFFLPERLIRYWLFNMTQSSDDSIGGYLIPKYKNIKILTDFVSYSLPKSILFPLVYNKHLEFLANNRMEFFNRSLMFMPKNSLLAFKLRFLSENVSKSGLSVLRHARKLFMKLNQSDALKTTGKKTLIEACILILLVELKNKKLTKNKSKMLEQVTMEDIFYWPTDTRVLVTVLELVYRYNKEHWKKILEKAETLLLVYSKEKYETKTNFINVDSLIAFGNFLIVKNCFSLSLHVFCFLEEFISQKNQSLRSYCELKKLTASVYSKKSTIDTLLGTGKFSTEFQKLELIDPEELCRIPVYVSRRFLNQSKACLSKSKLFSTTSRQIVKSGGIQTKSLKKKKKKKTLSAETQVKRSMYRWLSKKEKKVLQASQSKGINLNRAAQGSTVNANKPQKITASSANVEVKQDIKRKKRRGHR